MKIPEIKTPTGDLSTKRDFKTIRESLTNLQVDHENLVIEFRKLHSRVTDLEQKNSKMTDKIIRKARRSIMPICGFNFGLLFAFPLAVFNFPALLAITFVALLIKLATDVTDNENFLLDGLALGYLTATIVTAIVIGAMKLIG